MNQNLFSKAALFFQITAVVFFVFSKTDTVAQSLYSTVDYIKFVNFKSTHPNYTGDFRWRFYTSPTDKVCEKKSGVAFVNYSFDTNIFRSITKSINDDIRMSVEAWEEDSHFECNNLSACGMGDCDYNSGCNCDDDWHCDRSDGDKTFKLGDFEPGKENTVTIQYCNNQITYAFRYKPTSPEVSAVTYGKSGTENVYKGGNLCADTKIRLAVSTAMNPNFNNVLEYVWEYNIGNEEEQYSIPNPAYCGDDPSICVDGSTPQQPAARSKGVASPQSSPPVGTLPACCTASPTLVRYRTRWVYLGTTQGNSDSGALTLDLLSIYQIANLSSQTTILFKVTAAAHGVKSTNSGTQTLSISPRRPELGLFEQFQSCPNTPTGSIKLSGIKGSGKYQYTVRVNHDNNEPCTPVVGCLTGIKSGDFTGSSTDISPLDSGKYTLWISNYGGQYGVCSSTQNITIPAIPDLGIAQAIPQKDATCNGYADGEIKLNSIGGIGPYTYSLTNANAPPNNTGTFSGLKAGVYTASITDGCSQVNPSTAVQINITDPKRIHASAVGSLLTCESPADGRVVANINDGPGLYNYYLKRNGTTITKVENTGIVNWDISNRAAGNYVVEITDAQRPSCPGFSSPVTLTPPPALTITPANLQITPVSCNDGSDGKVALLNLDVTGKYNYTLTRSADHATYTTSTTPEISNLRGADYTLSMTRNVAGCNDSYTHPSTLTVTQPTPITIGLTKQNISCNGLTDGKITSIITGGGTNYSYTWQQLIGASWSTLASTAGAVSGRSEGTYRVRVKDIKNCTAVSDPIDIIEPAQLIITSATVQDIKCFGEKGRIVMTAQGGTGIPVYQYSLGGSSFTAFDASTPLPAGAYTVRATDLNGCAAQPTAPLHITTPTGALDLTYTLSDYNGVNISCFDGANGYAILTPSGGNGGSFSGYTYSLDTNPFQTSDKLEGINAGTHTLSVADGRGCIESQIVTFTQSTEKLSLTLTDKKDASCFGDQTGVLDVLGSVA